MATWLFRLRNRIISFRDADTVYPLINEHSYWTWLFIVSFPSKKMWFSIVMLVYQRVGHLIWVSGKHRFAMLFRPFPLVFVAGSWQVTPTDISRSFGRSGTLFIWRLMDPTMHQRWKEMPFHGVQFVAAPHIWSTAWHACWPISIFNSFHSFEW